VRPAEALDGRSLTPHALVVDLARALDAQQTDA